MTIIRATPRQKQIPRATFETAKANGLSPGAENDGPTPQKGWGTRKTKSVGEILRRKSAPQDDNKDCRPEGRRYEDAGLKPLRLPQGKPALRKAPGPVTNKKRERALGYKIGATLKTALRNLKASRVGHP